MQKYFALILLFLIVGLKTNAQSKVEKPKVTFSKNTNKWLDNQIALAKGNDINAVEKLASFYMSFAGHDDDATQYARQGDQLGSIKCTIILARLLVDYMDSSTAYFRKAALAGNVYAMNRTANWLMIKVAATKDTLGKNPAFTEAKKWLKLAAENGLEGAAENLAELEMAVDKPLQKGIDAYEKRDYLKAFKYFTAGAVYWKDNNCYFGLAGMYYEGLGTELDITIARNLYTKVGNQNNAVASYWAGYIYWNYFNDSKEAVNWLTQASKQGDARAQPMIEDIYNAIRLKQATDKAEYQAYLDKKDLEMHTHHPMTDLKTPAATFQWGIKKSYQEQQNEHEAKLRAASEKTFERSQKDYYRPNY